MDTITARNTAQHCNYAHSDIGIHPHGCVLYAYKLRVDGALLLQAGMKLKQFQKAKSQLYCLFQKTKQYKKTMMIRNYQTVAARP